VSFDNVNATTNKLTEKQDIKAIILENNTKDLLVLDSEKEQLVQKK
jgi:hypothetical protein